MIVYNNQIYIVNSELGLFKLENNEVIWNNIQYNDLEKRYRFIFSGNYTYSNTKDYRGPIIKKVDLSNGDIIWEMEKDDPRFEIRNIVSTPTYDIIQREQDGKIFLLSPETGEKLWAFENVEDPKNVSFNVYNNILIIFDGKSKLYAYNIE